MDNKIENYDFEINETEINKTDKIESLSFVEVNPLLPAGPAEQLFIAGASVFEITTFIPPIQRVTILGINLPDPDTFGPYDSYLATITIAETDDFVTEIYLIPTENKENWVGSTLLTFGGTLPQLEVEIRPVGYENRVGEVILQGPVFP